MAKKWTPEWVDNFNEDVVAKDYWHYGGLNGVSFSEVHATQT